MNGLTSASIDVIIPSLYIIWLRFQIIRVFRQRCEYDTIQVDN